MMLPNPSGLKASAFSARVQAYSAFRVEIEHRPDLGEFEDRSRLRWMMSNRNDAFDAIGVVASAFGVDALMPEATGVCLDYRDYGSQAVRTHFRFNSQGKIVHTACAPLASPLAA
jgi:hypothetical protein